MKCLACGASYRQIRLREYCGPCNNIAEELLYIDIANRYDVNRNSPDEIEYIKQRRLELDGKV